MVEPIWKLVQTCAGRLTREGRVPFTRGDLVQCVQQLRAGCNSGSINPIIQGLTENLRGGVSSPPGKTVLRSVGRGQFMLAGATPPDSPTPAAPEAGTKPETAAATTSHSLKEPHSADSGQDHRTISGYRFDFICSIDPQRNPEGGIVEHFPQDRYENAQNLPLNRYGEGPFCKFSIPPSLAQAGVYVLTAEGEPRYVGECQNLSRRFNMGYGNISPRNCYTGGQETNCRLNNLILESLRVGEMIDLWFHPTDDYKRVEQALLASRPFPWNRTMIWKNEPQPPALNPEPDPEVSLEARLRLCSPRYRLFFSKAGDLAQQFLEDREAAWEDEQSMHAVRLPDFISVDEMQELIASDWLEETELLDRHREAIADADLDDLDFGDWPEINPVLEAYEDRHDAVARVLAINESFFGFVRLVMSWLENREDYLRLFELGREKDWNQSSAELELCTILREEIPELPEEDILSATTLIIGMVDDSLERFD